MDTIEIIQIIVYVLGLVGFGFKITSFIKRESEQQRRENRQEHGKMFDTIRDLAVTQTSHNERLITVRRDINGIKNDIEIIEMKNGKTDEKINDLEKDIIKVGKVG